MTVRDTQIWQPGQEQLESSNITALMRRFGLARYEDLHAFALAEPGAYWDEVLEFCGIAWATPPEGYVDLRAGAAFPKWFPGGRLNWVQTILAWAHRPETSAQLAIVSEREDGTVSQVTYAELETKVKNLAAGLAANGIQHGDRVGLLMENGIEASVSVLAIAYLGAIVVPLFSGFGAEAIVSRLSSCDACAVIASTGFHRRAKRVSLRPAVEEAWARLPSVQKVIWKHAGDAPELNATNVHWASLASTDGSALTPAILEPHDPFMVIYTSGTTGKPKGTVHTHGGFPLKIAHDAAVHFDVKQGDVFCWPADMGWIAGSLVMASALLRGATLVCYDGAPDFPDWSRMSSLIEKHGITHFGSAPTLIRGLASNEAIAMQGDVSSIKLLITAGEGIDPEHFCWFQRHFGLGERPLINYTGGTEVSGALLSSVIVKPIRAGAFNTTSPGVDVDVVNPAGEPVVGRVGELVIRQPFVGMTQSFWRDDERYLDSYWRTLPGLWVHGDLAMRTKEGDFFILGRSDDTIKLAGKRVGPAEIEEVILELGEVAEAAAIGVDDAAKGQKLVVFIVRSPGSNTDAGLMESKVFKHIDDRLGRPFRPSLVHAVSQLPKTRSSKIMRRLIRSVYCGMPSGDLSALDNPAALDELRALAAAS